MGWLDEPLLPVSLKGQAFDTIDTTLYVMKLDPAVKIASNSIRLNFGVLGWESSLRQASPYYAELSPGGYVLRFRPAFPLPIQSVEQLSVNLATSTSVPPNEISVFLWNFEKGDWTKMESVIWGINIVSDPQVYVGPGGEVRLRITNPKNNYMVVSHSTIILTVTP
jgi:hypothetical protein